MKKSKAFHLLENFSRITLVIALIVSIIRFNSFNILNASLALILTYVPFWIEKKYKVHIPLDFEFAIVFFVYATLFLGEIQRFYDLFWWWDIFLHMFSSIAFGCIGFIIMYTLNKTNRINSKPIWIAFFAFCFAITAGTMWEIFEFSMDQFLGLNMQKSGLIDTMWDLIVAAIGALIASLAGLAFLKGSQKSYLSRLIGVIIKDNPNLKL